MCPSGASTFWWWGSSSCQGPREAPGLCPGSCHQCGRPTSGGSRRLVSTCTKDGGEQREDLQEEEKAPLRALQPWKLYLWTTMTVWNKVKEENAWRGQWWAPRCPADRSCLDAEPRKPPSAVWTLEPASLPVPSTEMLPRPPWSIGRNPGPVWQPGPGSPSLTGPEPGKTTNRIEVGVYLVKATSGTTWVS